METQKHYNGLSNEQVLESRKKYGENILTPPKREPLWKLFLDKFEDPIIRILLIAAFLSLGISFVNNEFAETIGIFCAILLATTVAFWFEMDANKKFDILNQVNDDTLIKVIRNGNICQVPKKDIVVGDIVLLEAGEEIPADGILLESVSLTVNESCLTGELSCSKSANIADLNSDSTYPTNTLLRGTTLIEGHCIFEVKKVGDNTEFGKVAKESAEETDIQTPLNQQLDGLAKFIGVVGLVLAAFTFITLFLKDLVFGQSGLNIGQIGSIGIVIISAFVALVKIWLPIVYDGFELAGNKKELPKSVEEGSWFRWIIYGIATFISFCLVGFLFGINPLLSSSWVDIQSAGRVLQYFMVAVTLIVVAVPEGLPMSVTLSLALSMRRMLDTNNLVRKMHACETMGATTVICTDKTGTLTQNQMQIHKTNFYGLNSDTLLNDYISTLIKEGISVNSTAHLDFSDKNKVKSIGNPTEAALLLWLNKNQINYLELRESTPVVNQLTFSTERKFMATLVNSPILNKKILYVKGAPEILVSKCIDVLTVDSKKDINAYKSIIEEQLLQYQNQAMRTLAFAYLEINDNETNFETILQRQFTFLGIAAISDPIREDVPDAVKKCINAGIDVKIVTGDTPGTAKEIGRQIGIWSSRHEEKQHLTGVEFCALTDDVLLKNVQNLKILSRARPSDKQRLVQLLQKSGSVVAVTGDGTNDAPALNFAHVGLSMGSGTSVAKEASDITLLDDSFNSIATAVMWGRSVYQNIQRFILFQLTINVAALVIVLLGSIFGKELPLTVTQMLWVNLIMDTFAAGALASLPPNLNVMKDKPRSSTAFIISRSMRNNILSVGFLFVVILLGLLYFFTDNGVISRYNLSMFFTIFVMLQFWNMFNAKAFSTGKSAFKNLSKSYGFIIVAAAILVGQFLIVEFGGEVFRTTPLSVKDWFIIIGSTSVVLWIGEVTRFLKRSK